jgi:hypothetical protein
VVEGGGTESVSRSTRVSTGVKRFDTWSNLLVGCIRSGGAAQMQSCRYDPAQREYFLSLAHLNMLVALEPGRVATKMGGAGAK